MKMQSKKNLSEGDVAYHGISTYYDQLREIETFMMEKFDIDDVMGMFKYLKNLIRHTIPYTLKYMDENEKKMLLTHDDILSLTSELKPGNTDSETKFNDKMKSTMISLIEIKWDKIKHLSAEAGLYLPLKTNQDDRPLAFANDGK